MTFWDKASTEERLAQIDGGIECGMTSKQIAMCLRAPIYGPTNKSGDAVKGFAHYHGRSFPTAQAVSSLRGGNSAAKTNSIRLSRKFGRPEILDNDAFSIFPAMEGDNPFASLTEEADA